MSVTAGRTSMFNTDGRVKFIFEASFGESVLLTSRVVYGKRNFREVLDVSAASVVPRSSIWLPTRTGTRFTRAHHGVRC